MKTITLNSTFFALLLLAACSPRVNTSISKTYPPLDYKEEVKVFSLVDKYPENAIEIGTVKVGDSGFSVKCGYDLALDNIKLQARKAGGNAVKITEHKPPDFLSSCHRITAKILRIENQPQEP